MKRHSSILTLLLTLPLISIAQVDHWESVILPGDEWQYLLPEQQPSENWTHPDFLDTSWAAGFSGFGYGDEDDATLLPEGTIAVYLRKEFEITNPSEVEKLVLDMDFDDGFVAYLNGVEVARAFISGEPPAFDQFSNGLHEALLHSGQVPDRYYLDHALLMEGNNLLAIEVHNDNINSSDLSAIPVLSVGVNTTSTHYRPTPDWFQVPPMLEFTSSNLPIVIIETGGREIPNEPKIVAGMKIISRSSGERNYLTDAENPEFLDYNGAIRIEVRGSSSQTLPKKQYSFTTYDANSEKANVSLLGMPEENDWILNGLAFDPSLMRDYLSYNLFRQMGHYATRTRYCEMVLNGEYRGLYVLQEKMKADGNRIDVNKIGPEDDELPQLSGGYVTKADKVEGDPVAWSMPNYGGWLTDYIHVTPKPEEVNSVQTEYIMGIFNQLEITASQGNASLINGYPSIIDIPSFIDFILINELAANVDAYQFSTYFHKDRNGKLRAGPIWDLNLTYGNDLFDWGYDRSKTEGWQFYDGDNMGSMFWKDLFDDAEFRCYMARRWNTLIQTGQPLHPEIINAYIDQITGEIGEAVVREEDRWKTVGNHTGHLYNIKRFIQERSAWMTTQLGDFGSCSSVRVPKVAITRINYHPSPNGELSDKDQEFMEITNIGDAITDLTGVYIGGTGLVYQFPPNTVLDPGEKVHLANDAEVFRQVYGFLPFDEFSRSLSNSGQAIRFMDAFGNLVDEVTYMDEAPWPISADGDGAYLQVIDPRADNDDPANWTAASGELVTGSKPLPPVLTLYPNPAGDRVQISTSAIIESLVLYDQQGKKVKSAQPRASIYDLSLKELPAGVYFISIRSAEGMVTRKVKKE